MPYVTSVERLAKQEGRTEGQLQGLRESVLDALEARFADVPYPLGAEFGWIKRIC